MKTKIIKLGDGCNLTVTLIDRQGMPIKLATLKSLDLRLVKDTEQEVEFTANSNNTLSMELTYTDNLTETGMYLIKVEGELSDGQSFGYTEQIIEVKDLQDSTGTDFITSIVLRDVRDIEEKDFPEVNYKGLGYESFSPFKPYTSGQTVVFGDSLYKFTDDKTEGLWDATKVEPTSVAESAGGGSIDISGKADKVPVAYSIPNDGMLPNVLYNFGELSSNTTFTLAAATDNTVMNVWRWKFSTGNTVPTITLPSGLAWEYGEEPVFEPNQTYLIVVTEGIAVCISTAGVKRLINGILFGLQNGLPSLRVEELTIARKLDAYIKEGNALTSGAGAPAILPQYNGQEYFDTTNKVWYKASYTGTEPTASAWKQITN